MKNCYRLLPLLGLVLLLTACKEEQKAPEALTNYQQWHTVTLDFEGPQTTEAAENNPFLNYRLQVTFTHAEKQYTVRGFYAADGNAGETGADSGNVWRVRFTPDRIGEWAYTAQLEQGDSIAVKPNSEKGTGIEIKGAKGAFEVVPSDKRLPDFRAKGRLMVSNGYFRFGEDGDYWIKGGADSPENLLAFEDFDGTYRMQSSSNDGEAHTNDTIHSFMPHLGDWEEGDVSWQNGKGKGLIGAMNYLASKGMNVVYFLTMNIKGDGKDVWPYKDPDDFTRFDVSKLAQWELVFQHMQRKGLMLHMVLQETENETMLHDGDTGPLRQLYFQELMARFGHHLALKFNLGEENGPADFTPIAQNDAQRKAMTTYLKKIDPYNHPVLLHTHSHEPARSNVLDSIVGFKELDGLSLQVDKRESAAGIVADWRAKSKRSGKEWLITMDEIGMWHTGAVPDSVTPQHDTLRRYVLWGTLMSGAAGVEWYYGAHNAYNDLNTEDWRTTDRLWELTHHAMQFFEQHLPYWEMQPRHDLIGIDEGYCFYKKGTVYAAYVPGPQKNVTLNLEDETGEFSVHWYNPLEGGELLSGTVKQVAAGTTVALGSPSTAEEQDWVVLVKLME